MKDILMIAHFISTQSEKGNGRFTHLADMLMEKENDFEVEIVTTSFSHCNKKQRNIKLDTEINSKYKLTIINEPGYDKNISLKRFYSHFVLGKNLKKYLQHRKKPDVIYCAVPSLDMAYEAARYARNNNVKFIIDIQDLWPEAFRMVFDVPIISYLLFRPMEIISNYIYKTSDEIIAVSETYVNRALEVNKKLRKGTSIFLGTEIAYFDQCVEKNKVYKPKDDMWLTYIGTLGHSYDLTVVMEALKIVQGKGIDNIKFMVIGDGPLKEKFENYSEQLKINIDFTGRLDYEKMVGYLSKSDIAVNPIVKGAAGSIINKVGDYAAAGLPVLNTQECQEYRNLIKEYNCGINCINGDPIDLAEKIITLYNDSSMRYKLGSNNRALAEEKFDRAKVYNDIISIIKGV